MKSVKKILTVMLIILLSFALLYPSGMVFAGDHDNPMPIKNAKPKPVGTKVTVQGIVTVTPGTFDRGFAIQDDTGGIYIYPPNKVSLKLGDEVMVTGEKANYKGLMEIKPESTTDIKVVGHKAPVQPKHFKTGEIGAKTCGLLVEVTGKVVSKKNYYFFMDDGSGKCEVYKKKYVKINMEDIKVGEELTVVGFSSQYNSYYEILPRGPQDIKMGGGSNGSGNGGSNGGGNGTSTSAFGLSAKVTNNLSVMLKWKAPSTNNGAKVNEYKIYKGEESGNETLLASVQKTEYEDKDVKAGDTYYYYVEAVLSTGDTEKSNEISVTVELQVNPPAGLKAKVKNGEVVLMWSSSKGGKNEVAGYAIYRSTESGAEPDVPIAVVDAKKTTYVDTSVEPGNTYYYIIKAFDNENPPVYSPPSNEVSVEVEQVDKTPPMIILDVKNGMTTSKIEFTIKGKVSDKGTGIASLTVNGNSVNVAQDGSFSYTVMLTEGVNTITIVATDKAGNKAIKTVKIKYMPKTVIKLKPNDPMMEVNGVEEQIDPGRDTKPVIIPKWGRTVVPIRAIVEALGGTISWDPVQRMVTIELNGTIIKLWIGKPQAEVNGVMKWIDPSNHDVRPIIINGRTMLPIRFIAENLGYTVNWDPVTKTITITYQAP